MIIWYDPASSNQVDAWYTENTGSTVWSGRGDLSATVPANLKSQISRDVRVTVVDGAVTATTANTHPTQPIDSATYTDVPFYVNGSTSATTYGRVGMPWMRAEDAGVRGYKAVTILDNRTYTYDLRVYDLTNSQVIAEVTGLSNATEVIIDFGAVSNLPTSPAIFELQAKVSDVAATVTVYSISTGR